MVNTWKTSKPTSFECFWFKILFLEIIWTITWWRAQYPGCLFDKGYIWFGSISPESTDPKGPTRNICLAVRSYLDKFAPMVPFLTRPDGSRSYSSLLYPRYIKSNLCSIFEIEDFEIFSYTLVKWNICFRISAWLSFAS